MDHYMTEATAMTKASDILVYVYEFPVDNPTEKHKGVSRIVYKWRQANNGMPLSFKESTIVSFEEVTNFVGHEPLSKQYRTLNMNVPFERSLLERLVKESLVETAKQKLKLKRVGDSLQEWKAKDAGTILLYPSLSIHVDIVDQHIRVGFDTSHKFEYKQTLQQLIMQGTTDIQQLPVLHSNIKNNFTYVAEKIADYSVYDICPLMKRSIYHYYEEKNDVKTLKLLEENPKVVHVTTRDGQTLSYPANVLRVVCSYETMTDHEVRAVQKLLKLAPDERMKTALRQMKNILNEYSYLQFAHNPFFVEENGYEVAELRDPHVQFREVFPKVVSGLRSSHLFNGGEMTLSVFLDEAFERQCHIAKRTTYKFVKTLQTIARLHGVTIHVSDKTKATKGQFTEEFFHDFAWSVRRFREVFEETTVLAFVTTQHSSRMYDDLKRQFGGKWDLSSQVVTETSVREFEKLLKQRNFIDFNDRDEAACLKAAQIVQQSRLLYTIYNILLGLYVKGGMQPWVLAERTHSDCFIGLDVSHEEGKSAAGIINVIGANGKLIKQSAINGSLAGEKIDETMLRDILGEVLHSYKEQCGTWPKHVTIHRDGRWREKTELVERLLHKQDIAFDIVEIIKKPNRRMACYERSEQKFKTVQGMYYVRGREAFLCATNPREIIGMAQPIKIVQQTSHFTMKQIVEDVYALSFMHIHSINKMRLPATIHYADLSSTAYQRGQIVPNSANVTHLPFV